MGGSSTRLAEHPTWAGVGWFSHRQPVAALTQLWLYLHVPLVTAMAAGGAGVLNTVEHAATPLPDGVRWLLVGSLAAKATLFAAAILALAVGLTDWGARACLTAVVALLLAPVAAGLDLWARRAGSNAVDVA